MAIEMLLAPISQNSPCGPDLEYDPDFMALDQASKGKPDQQFGDTKVPAEEPDWVDVKQRAEALFSRTKDLRVALWMTRALIHSEGMLGLASGLQLIHGVLTRYWESVHPRLDSEENNSPAMRLNVLASLADPHTLLRDVRRVSFISTDSHTQISMREILAATGKLPGSSKDGVPSQIAIEKIIRAKENSPLVQAVRAALQTIGNIHTFLGDKVSYDRVPDLQPLKDMLKTVVQLGDTAAGPSQAPPREGSVALAPIGDMHSREDAIRMLDKVCEFIERTEPANPAPLLIRRAQRLMAKNFVEIIRDLAPGSLDQIQHITGLDPK